jgi:hypothetical protein
MIIVDFVKVFSMTMLDFNCYFSLKHILFLLKQLVTNIYLGSPEFADWWACCYVGSILSCIKWVGYKNIFTTMYPISYIAL